MKPIKIKILVWYMLKSLATHWWVCRSYFTTAVEAKTVIWDFSQLYLKLWHLSGTRTFTGREGAHSFFMDPQKCPQSHLVLLYNPGLMQISTKALRVGHFFSLASVVLIGALWSQPVALIPTSAITGLPGECQSTPHSLSFPSGILSLYPSCTEGSGHNPPLIS